jgi:hypothetical protein
MKTLFYISGAVLAICWAIAFIVFQAPDSIHLVLLIAFLAILKAMRPEKENRITHIENGRSYIE